MLAFVQLFEQMMTSKQGEECGDNVDQQQIELGEDRSLCSTVQRRIAVRWLTKSRPHATVAAAVVTTPLWLSLRVYLSLSIRLSTLLKDKRSTLGISKGGYLAAACKIDIIF